MGVNLSQAKTICSHKERKLPAMGSSLMQLLNELESC